jgi:single-stranded-DNA-specific exonuclease
VAIGTIADMVKLHGVNRTLAKAGMEVFSENSNKGLQELKSLAGLGKSLNSEDISFQIGPRLNAAGRMGDAGRASKLLFTEDRGQARELAMILDRENQSRKSITSAIVDEAMAKANNEKSSEHCLILHGLEWHEGLIGIAASKLLNHFHKPTIILTGKDILKGSLRSIDGINIHDILVRCDDLLISYGGHSAAAGLSIEIDKLDEFKQRVKVCIAEIWNDEIGTPVQVVNLSVSGTDSTVCEGMEIAELIKFNQLLQPFGQDNPEPVYCTDDLCRLRNIKLIGKERNHLRFDALINGTWLNSIGFGFGQQAFNCLVDRQDGCRIAFYLQYNSFRGQKKIQLRLVDFM